MTAGIALTIVAVLALCAVGAYVARYGRPGLKTRTVWCPVFKMHADIATEQNETAFAKTGSGPTVTDVKRCSLFKDVAPRCEKECLQQP